MRITVVKVYYLSGTLRVDDSFRHGRPNSEEAIVREGGAVLARGGPVTRGRRSPARGGGVDLAAQRPAPPSPELTDRFYAAVRLVVRFWLWFCFTPVDVRHPEHVPADGPVLLCINHPNNLIDSLVVAAALRRK